MVLTDTKTERQELSIAQGGALLQEDRGAHITDPLVTTTGEATTTVEVISGETTAVDTVTEIEVTITGVTIITTRGDILGAAEIKLMETEQTGIIDSNSPPKPEPDMKWGK